MVVVLIGSVFFILCSCKIGNKRKWDGIKEHIHVFGSDVCVWCVLVALVFTVSFPLLLAAAGNADAVAAALRYCWRLTGYICVFMTTLVSFFPRSFVCFFRL